ncbi:LysM peptidoglycan-binding domain-containing protein [Flavobacterium agrisoli]|uniref:LysM peptidoglycan-binding domain-containing protein n=1 Tax=Flavobacterium agrisoli TaxID=2793066 RepID=A0A934PLJ2_9FLAO|nr:LysM peptidoglycan-binding domain-containing protein [Flavobacterium agrisoli]MBK0369158.1 LysM peptidoglycan-binding domain-containing protein [Flavobacterium agrisoli]
MRYLSILCVASLMFSCVAFAQSGTVKHTVAKDETINQIAQKYQVTPYDIYQLNPDVKTGLKPGLVLLIPKKSSKNATVTATKSAVNSNVKTHLVQPKETLYGIEKKYNISDEALKKANPFLVTDGLQIGQTLVISNGVSTAKEATKKEKKESKEAYVYHDVQPKETKYSIAKKYNISIEELEKKNPEIIQNLPIGFRLTIKGSPPKQYSNPVVTTSETPVKSTAPKQDLMDYQVKPKETLYSLSKSFGLTQEELVSLNPILSNGVQEGMILKVPVQSTPVITSDFPKNTTVLSAKVNSNERKKMALLLPFNVSVLENDTENSIQERLKRDKFLNMTLDFYSGALMAIDSAKVLGLPIDVAIYDSQENKNGSNVSQILQKNNLQTADAIIGPFYQSNAETAANYLRLYNVPVISPLSKDRANPISNLYQSVPTNDMVKNTMFEYMRKKNGNIIAVVDPKKESTIQYIKQNQLGVAFASFSSTGALDGASITNLLVPGKMNYVVMETANTWMVKTTIKTLVEAMKSYQVQLVVLEPNATLESDEINFSNLVKLHLMYPSVNRENDTEAARLFKKEYKKDNNILPNTFATRGFDVTFDTMMRLVQGQTYQETTKTVTTEQVDNKFQFYTKEDGGHANRGVYILYYDDDLTIKEAN